MARRKIPKTPLEDLLDPDQTASFAAYLFRRYTSVTNQLAAEFWPKRKKYYQQMMDDFSWRSGGRSRERVERDGINALWNDIFDKSNDSLNIVGGFAAFMSARTVDDVKGTEPFYNIFPEGIADNVLAEAMQKHSEWKLRKSNMSPSIDDAIDFAYGLGEGVIKLRWKRDFDVYERPATVLYHDGLKAPVTTSTGEYIHEGDELGESDVPAMDDAGQPVPDALTGLPSTKTVITPAKDPSIQVDKDAVRWKPMAIEETNVRYNGVRSEIMHWGDFLCPLTEADVQESNFVGHKFQMRLSEAIAEYNLDEDTIARFRSDTTDPKAEKNLPDAEQQEDAESLSQFENDDPFILFCECWVSYDPVGDRRNRRMMAVLAVQYELIVSMDYMANVTPEGVLPFFVNRAFRVKNRWYGRGFYETYEKAQEFIDRQLNRIEYRNQFHTNPPKFLDTSLLVEGVDTDEPFELIPGATWTKKTGVKTEDVFSFATLPDLDERTWQLMQFMIQIIQVRSGITSAAQGEVSSLPSTSTATGIESIMQSASTLARLPIGNLKTSIEAGILFACKLIYANLDRDEVYTYFDGDQQMAATLVAEQVKGIDMNVHLLLTRFKQRENVEAAEKAQGWLTWYLSLPEQEKGGPRIIVIQAIKGLGFNQAPQIVRAPLQMQTVIDPATGQPVQVPAGQPGQPGQPGPGQLGQPGPAAGQIVPMPPQGQPPAEAASQ